MELSPTAYVILGMLGKRPMSGYDIKRFVDHSTRFFWAASYGQIYPELRRLADAGLIEGDADGESARRRIEFRLTRTGRAELERWLGAPSEVYEMRDEYLLKLFFSDIDGPAAATGAIAAKASHHREVAAELRRIETEVSPDPAGGTGTVLRFGIEFHDFVAGWCEREATERAK